MWNKNKLKCLVMATILPLGSSHIGNAVTSVVTYVGEWVDCAQNFSEGTGSKSSPYKISKPEQLAYIAKKVALGTTFKGVCFVLGNNIDLAGREWSAIGKPGSTAKYKFSGNFNGNGKSISNLKIDKRDQHAQGLFGYIENAEVKDVRLVNCSINGKSDVGGIAGFSFLSQVSGCTVEGVINGQENVGAITGRLHRSDVEKSASSSRVRGILYTGGIVGNISRDSHVDQCYSLGEVCGSGCVGGLVGISTNSVVKNSFSRAAVVGRDSSRVYAGGLVGSNGGKLKNSYAACQINLGPGLDAKTCVAGLIVGNDSGTIKKTYYSKKASNPLKLKAVFQSKCSYNEQDFELNEHTTKKLMNSNKFLGIWGKTIWAQDSSKNNGCPYLIELPLLSS